MREISTRELKDHLSESLREVEGGGRLVITRSGRPVAALVPIAELSSTDSERVLADLAARGVIRPAAAVRSSQAFGGTAVPSRGRSASQMVLEDRR
jgi:prevent-host-death family protein